MTTQPNKELAHFVGPKLPDVKIPETCYAEAILEKLKKRLDDNLFIEYPSRREVKCSFVRSRSISLGNVIKDILNYKKGDVACICSYNISEFCIAVYGSTIAGMGVMLCNSLYSYYEINHQLLDSKTALLFIPGDKVFLEKSLKAVEGTKVRTIILLTKPEDPVYFEKLKQEHPNVEMFVLEDLFDETKADVYPVVENWDWKNDIAIIPYSSGTTGKAKGVVLTHESMRQYIKQFMLFEMQAANTAAMKRGSTSYVVPPAFHIYGYYVLIQLTPFLNDTAVIQPRFNFTDMLQSIQEYKISRLYLVPAVMVQLSKSVHIVSQYDLRTVQLILFGAAPMAKDQLEVLYNLFDKTHPPTFMQVYALTEGHGTSLPIGASKDIVMSGTVGNVSAGNEAKIVDLNTLETLPIDAEGEIWLRSTIQMNRYLNRPEETEKTVTKDGWLRTGDIGKFNKEGFLFITDRLKELVKYKGYQVPPAELEDVLLSHPAVCDAAVAGKPDEEAGELPTAFVVLREDFKGKLTKEELQMYVKERVAPYKQLKGGVHFMEKLPRNASGKLMRRNLIEMTKLS